MAPLGDDHHLDSTSTGSLRIAILINEIVIVGLILFLLFGTVFWAMRTWHSSLRRQAQGGHELQTQSDTECQK